MRTGRPRSATDEAIFAAVSEVVTESGPGGLTLGAVAERVGVSAPALTQRFGSKRNLLLAYASAAATGVLALSTRARASSPTPLAALRSMLLEFTAGLDSRAAVANNLAFLHLDLTDPDLGAHATKQSRLLKRSIASLIREAIEAGEIDAGVNPDVVADTVYTVYNGALVTWAIDGKGTLAHWLTERLDRVLAPHQS